MEQIDKLYSKLCVPTQILKIETIQELLLKAKEYQRNTSQYNGIWNLILEVLWSHLQSDLKKLDDQLLCATCFFSVMSFTDTQDFYMTAFLKCIDDELAARKSDTKSMKTCQVISLAYGMFQSPFITLNNGKNMKSVGPVLESVVNLLLLMAYDYSQYTFLVFKTLKSLKKVCGTCYHQFVFNEENHIKLLNLVNHNWENPITGVRDMNRSVFQMLISNIDDTFYVKVISEINSFYWNKAKYLMLSEIIECKMSDVTQYIENNWIEGLVGSLYKPGLVSAGTDMYYALLKQINSDEQWCSMFLAQIMSILCSESVKAIENFTNYWCLTTVKKFPSLIMRLVEELSSLDNTNIFSCLSVIKQGNKIGVIEKKWDNTCNYTVIEKSVLKGIQHCNSKIRILAFDIVCVSQGKSMPTTEEYKLILDYLISNINSDCTVLRLSMLNAFNIFLTELHLLYLNILMKTNDNDDKQNLLDFCCKLQVFLADSLNLDGNYQRKITSIKLCEIFLKCVTEVVKKRKAQTRINHKPLLLYLKEEGYWSLSEEVFLQKLLSFLKDPAEDVRENTIRILLYHYSSELQKGTLMQTLTSEGLACMRSKFFYEISCGQSIFKLITNMLLTQEFKGTDFKNAEDVFFFAYNELISEYKLKNDLMKSIETGKQLHSFMGIMFVVLEESYIHSYNIDISSIKLELMGVLGYISNQLNWEEDSSTSSDFSKMTDMIQNIIINSGYNPSDTDDQTKISGLQQIVLNSLWLNVKASCDLVSILIKYNIDDVGMSETCLNIITHVLESSRHKGVIEAAGAALGHAIQYLTSLPDEYILSEVPYMVLAGRLQDLVSETNKMSSITRRGAGLSIMVHRIVSSDMKKGKPLFHYFMNSLLKLCLESKEVQDGRTLYESENQVDLPQAIYIHFMTRIVTDSSLASELMFYSAQLAELAFTNLVSPQWQIRNAALQLYGALIPRQIGQKKASGDHQETIATVAFDELQSHNLNLWHYIIGQLKKQDISDQIQYHSNLIPILNMLASLARRYNFSFDKDTKEYANDEFLQHLLALLGSPIFTVRRLTAKSIFNIYDYQTISEALLKEVKISENFLHGSLILLHLCHQQYYGEGVCEHMFMSLKEKYKTILTKGCHSYLCKELYEDIYITEYSFKDIECTLMEMKNNINKPGVFTWGEKRLRKYIFSCKWSDLKQILQLILQQSEYEKYCQMILLKLEHGNGETEALKQIVDTFLSFEGNNNSSVIWEIIYKISKKITPDCIQLESEKYLMEIKDAKKVIKLRYIIPLLAMNIAQFTDENKIVLLNVINDLCSFENSDVDIRYIAAIAINEIAKHFNDLADPSKVVLIKCIVLLLQDEDEDVRNLSVCFYETLCKENLHPFIVLTNLLKKDFLQNLFQDPKTYIEDLFNQLSNVLDNMESKHIVDEYNPFTNNSKNIYLETEVLKKMIGNLKHD